MFKPSNIVPTEDALRGIERAWQSKMAGLQLDTYVSRTKPSIHLALIILPESERKSGSGSQIMQEVIAVADQFECSIHLTPFEGYGTPFHVLEKFYASFGFEWIKEDLMVRIPA